jgi:predicted 3-demethylubiquinone-9 3-methyltransferase (glyoxalase superfamily)
MPKVTPFLWFNNNAEEAMNFYVSIFKNSKIISVQRWPEGGPAPKGSVLGGEFELDGQRFKALNGGPNFKFTPAISLYVDCTTQQEVDELWSKLSASPADEQCGWLKDKFGLSWQIIPTTLTKLLGDKDSKKAGRVMQAMLTMKKIDIAGLEQAAAG